MQESLLNKNFFYEGCFMFLEKSVDWEVENQQKKIADLKKKNDVLNKEINDFYEELKLTPEQLSTFLQERDNFTESNWEELLQQRKALDDKLAIELENICNPLKTKLAYSSRNVDKNWLFVR